jgi:hypothetical protein
VYEDKRVFLELRAGDMFAKVLMLADFIESKGNAPVMEQERKEVS